VTDTGLSEHQDQEEKMFAHRISKLAMAATVTIAALAGGSMLALAHPGSNQGPQCAAVASAPGVGQADLTMALPVSDSSPPPLNSVPNCPIPNPG
jgi:hypothetical protein